jgi:branched-chain amino acid transport system ATP-binding protein
MLRLEGVTCGYGAFRAVTDLTIEVPEGSVFALIGANGAGKSSTLMTVAGHVQVFAGAVVFAGEVITTLPARRRVGLGIAIVPEGRRLFPDLTVDENLTVGGYSRDRRAAANSREWVVSLFPRLGERMNQLAGSLSGGEQQMLAIGRALMADPKLLLIDEISLGLMPAMVDVCYAAIAKLKAEGLTIVLVEQSTSRAFQVADHVCVLESGRSVWHGTGADAARDPTLIEAYLGIAASSGQPAR